MHAELERIAALGDLEAQGHALAALLRTVEDGRRLAVAARRVIIDKLRAAGYSHQQVADVIELKRGTASQLAAGKQTGRRRATRSSDPEP